ncbi:amino acid ABC transporter permease [Candidatus Bipolaricaulota bacterium]|nr:amino acid ABC transporter permease [Candidatus Bipolaricaulota bacterium]
MSTILQSLELLIVKGLPTTVLLTLGLLATGLLLGFPLAFAQVYGYRPLRWLCRGYEQIFRGIPALVLILIFHSGLARSFNILLPAFTSALIALGLRSSAYQSQIFRGAIQSVSEGQMMAARSMGMSKLQAIRYIILPQAFRLSIPPWTNEYSSVLKDTSLASAIGVLELMKEGTLIMTRIQFILGARYILLILALVAFVYLILTYLGNAGLGLLENRLRIPGFEMKGKVER